jgi:hypothetical protein
MKAATGELNLTLITIIALGAILAFLEIIVATNSRKNTSWLG